VGVGRKSWTLAKGKGGKNDHGMRPLVELSKLSSSRSG
jgi:hypothetical protein